MLHELKVVQPFYNALKQGIKNFEVRRDDREPAFAVGDVLRLREWEGFWGGSEVDEHGLRRDGGYTGADVRRCVTYILRHVDFPEGVPEGWCILGFEKFSAEVMPVPEEDVEDLKEQASRYGQDVERLVRRGWYGRTCEETTISEDSWKGLESLQDLPDPVRTTDPQASRDGAQKIRRSRGALRIKVLKVFILAGPGGATNEDLYKAYPEIKPDSLRPRVGELLKLGLIRECGRSLGSCGVYITRWCPTEAAENYVKCFLDLSK